MLLLSKGKTRVSIWDLATAKWNRNGTPTSGRHAQLRITSIMKKEGFAEYKYNAGWCIAPNPKNVYETWEHHEEMRVHDRLLVKLERKPLDGVFKCTHLVAGLQMWAQEERFYGAPYDQEKMSLADGNEEAVRTVREGIYMERFNFDDFEKNKDAFVSLMNSDNVDHATGLAYDEVQLIAAMYEQMALYSMGTSTYEEIVQTLQSQSGGKYGDADIKKVWTFVASANEPVSGSLVAPLEANGVLAERSFTPPRSFALLLCGSILRITEHYSVSRFNKPVLLVFS